MREQNHSYEIISSKDGIHISPKEENRPILNISLSSNGFWTIDSRYSNIPLYAFRSMLESSVDQLYMSYKSPKEKFKKFVPKKMMAGMKLVTRKCLAKHLKDEWLRHIEKLDPMVVELHRKCFSVSCGRMICGWCV